MTSQESKYPSSPYVRILSFAIDRQFLHNPKSWTEHSEEGRVDSLGFPQLCSLHSISRSLEDFLEDLNGATLKLKCVDLIKVIIADDIDGFDEIKCWLGLFQRQRNVI